MVKWVWILFMVQRKVKKSYIVQLKLNFLLFEINMPSQEKYISFLILFLWNHVNPKDEICKPFSRVFISKVLVNLHTNAPYTN
jgi:hypothetical protein